MHKDDKKTLLRRGTMTPNSGKTTPSSKTETPDDTTKSGNNQVDIQHTPNVEPELSAREEIELIKKENLTGRQLRMARRLVQKNGLQVTSDLDAVRVLRKKGLDPFESTTGKLKEQNAQSSSGNLPATVRTTNVPDNMPMDNEQRMAEVHKIQQDLVKRRRRRIAATLTKLFCFVAIPSIIAGYYFYKVATPMYASFTEFVIQKADNPATAGAGGLLSSSLLATAQDSIAVQGYLSSRVAMNRLDADKDFRTTFQGDQIDILQRLDSDASNEATYKTYKKRVQIGFDPTEGIIKMEVITPNPEKSLEFSKALIGYAEEQVDQLTQRMREDQMKGARDGYNKAEQDFLDAQARVVDLQEKLGVLNPEIEVSSQMSLIQQLETDLQQRRLELIELLDNPRPNQTKLSVLESSIKSREDMIGKLRSDLTEGTDIASSLAKVTAELQSAQTQVVVRQELLASSLLQLETARVEANRQTRYLSMSVFPVPPDEPTYPKTFENTLLSVLVFAGIYLLVSLTASILREQLTT